MLYIQTSTDLCRKKSTSTQLLECLHDWTKALDNKILVDVVYIDFAKAFDTVSHNKLVYKLSLIIVRGPLLKWISAFLSNRKFRVKLGNSFSDYRRVTSGVPQGSILGPTLFLLYINDIVFQFPNVQCKMFADDMKLFVKLDHNDCMLSQSVLQSALDSLVIWSNTWQLEISAPKCSILHLGRNNPEFKYLINNKIVKSADQCKDLGILISRNLKPSTHCNAIATKAYRIINMLFRCFNNCDVQVLLKCYVSYVRPILEYSSTVWSPCLMRDIDKIESVQRYSTRRLFARAHLKECSYKIRLLHLNLDPLELRRLKYDLIMVFKCLKQKISACQNVFQLSHNQNTRGHELKLLKPKLPWQTL